MMFRFEKPAGFDYKAGQYVDITLINPSEMDGEGNSRSFSLVSHPSQDTIAITTRMRDTAFKRVLKNMPEGTAVNIEGPFGSFTLHNDTNKPAVFLAGGIGITPMYSIVCDASLRHLPHKLYLLYSNRRPEDAAFLKELQELHSQNENFTFIGTMTDMENSQQSWQGPTGYITKDMIFKHVPDVATAIYYLAGPAAMVQAMRKVLNDAGVNDDNIKTEEFSGY